MDVEFPEITTTTATASADYYGAAPEGAAAAAAAGEVEQGVSTAPLQIPRASSPDDPPTQQASNATATKKLIYDLPKRVTKTTLTFKSDIIGHHARDGHPRGILHATKYSTAARPMEEHAFAWIADEADLVIPTVVEHLAKYDFRPSLMRFIPYSSKKNWMSKYPHAMPYVDCDGERNISGNVPPWEDILKSSASAAAATTASSTSNKKSSRKRGSSKNKREPPKLLSKGNLTNAERDELHLAVYEYFLWMHGELIEMETNYPGRRQVSAAGVNVPALASLVAKLEVTFRNIQLEKERKGKEEQERTAAASSDVAKIAAGLFEDGAMEAAGIDVVEGLEPHHSPLPENNNVAATLPFLERTLEADLQRMIVEKAPKKSASSSTSQSTDNNPEAKRQFAEWRYFSFDTLFQKLLEFKAEKGHATPPLKHPELGRWVSEIRANKKALREKGLEYEPKSLEEGESLADKPTDAPAMLGINSYLSEERLALLDSVGFVWSLAPPRMTWEERFEELRQFREQNGRFPTNKEGGVGGWLKCQRKLYSKKDSNFMLNHCAKLEELGVPLRQRNYTVATWDDRFQQLVEFGRVNRHFNIPNPDDPDNFVGEHTTDVAEARRFYKFVSRVQTEYRALQKGLPVIMLNDERIVQLRNIGFEFSTTPHRTRQERRTVPDVDWSMRIQQMEAFLSEMGHLRVDPNYYMYSNLGGWAVQMSQLHRSWQEGREYIPPEMVEKFNQLNAMGFGFDVFPTRRGERSWEDSFGLLLQYRQETGSCRVPHHYKADFRLGSWVAVQRKDYKLLVADKPSRLTHDRARRLESIGFEWVARQRD